MNTNSKENKRRLFSHDNIAWGLTALLVICASIVFYLVLTKMPNIMNGLSKIATVLMPVLLGVVMAYLILPLYNWLSVKLGDLFAKSTKISDKNAKHFTQLLSTIISVLVLILVVAGLIQAAVPQVVQSGIRLADSMPSNIDNFTSWLMKTFKDYPEVTDYIVSTLNTLENGFADLFSNYIGPWINNMIGSVTKSIISVVSFIFNLIIGLIVCVYLLNLKSTFAGQAKKIVYSIFHVDRANRLIEDARVVHRIFSGFINGKLIDSLIIGCITYIAMVLIGIPYAAMLAVIIGVTNIIPFFGPFIGAVPCLFIVLTVDPLKALYLLIYIIVIQQIDGNLIGPKIIGNTTGLDSFWVLFAILVGGGLFGFVGMILGVPVFAVIFHFCREWIENSLTKKGMNQDTGSYIRLDHIDPKTGEFVDISGAVPAQDIEASPAEASPAEAESSILAESPAPAEAIAVDEKETH